MFPGTDEETQWLVLTRRLLIRKQTVYTSYSLSLGKVEEIEAMGIFPVFSAFWSCVLLYRDLLCVIP